MFLGAWLPIWRLSFSTYVLHFVWNGAKCAWPSWPLIALRKLLDAVVLSAGRSLFLRSPQRKRPESVKINKLALTYTLTFRFPSNERRNEWAKKEVHLQSCRIKCGGFYRKTQSNRTHNFIEKLVIFTAKKTKFTRPCHRNLLFWNPPTVGLVTT